MNNKSLVSVIIPCYKMGDYIGVALESVSKQTYKNWEVIVVDDCGPEDGTSGIVDSFATSHSGHRIEFIRHEQNGGVSKTRNTAIQAASGDYLAFLDPDDFWASSYLEKHVSELGADSNSNVAATYTECNGVDKKGETTGHIYRPTVEQIGGLPASLYLNNFIMPSAVVVRKESVVSCGGFDESPEMQHVEDWDLWIRMMTAGSKFSYIPSAGSYWRRHEGASTSDSLAMQARESALRIKHSELFAGYSATCSRRMLNRIEHLEGKQKALEGSLLFRISRLLSKCIGR